MHGEERYGILVGHQKVVQFLHRSALVIISGSLSCGSENVVFEEGVGQSVLRQTRKIDFNGGAVSIQLGPKVSGIITVRVGDGFKFPTSVIELCHWEVRINPADLVRVQSSQELDTLGRWSVNVCFKGDSFLRDMDLDVKGRCKTGAAAYNWTWCRGPDKDSPNKSDAQIACTESSIR